MGLLSWSLAPSWSDWLPPVWCGFESFSSHVRRARLVSGGCFEYSNPMAHFRAICICLSFFNVWSRVRGAGDACARFPRPLRVYIYIYVYSSIGGSGAGDACALHLIVSYPRARCHGCIAYLRCPMHVRTASPTAASDHSSTVRAIAINGPSRCQRPLVGSVIPIS